MGDATALLCSLRRRLGWLDDRPDRALRVRVRPVGPDHLAPDAGNPAVVATGWRTILGVNVLWLGLSMLFDGLNALVLPERVAALVGEGAATAVGLYSLVGIGLGMLIQPLVGAVSDRYASSWGRFLPLSLLIVALVVSLLLFAAASTLIAVVIAYVVVQLVANAAQAVHQPLLPDLVSDDRVGRASGVKGTMDLLGAVLGFALLGWLLEARGISVAMATLAGVLVTTFVLARLLVGRTSMVLAEGPAPSRPRVPIYESHSRRLVRVVLSRFLFLAGTYAIGRFFLFFVAHRLDLSVDAATEEAGALLGGLALLTAVAAIPSGWASDRFGRVRVMWFGAAASGLGALLLIGAQGMSTLFVFGALMSLGSASFSAANWASAADLAPIGRGGRVLGLANLGTGGAAAAAGAFGPLVDAGNSTGEGFGYVLLLAAAAACFALSALPLIGLAADRTPSDPLRSLKATTT